MIISGVLFVLTHQCEPVVCQSGESYAKWDDALTEIPIDIPREAVKVVISSKQITTIKANAFLHLSQCIHLELRANISEIEPRAFNGLTALTTLWIIYSKGLERLYKNMFFSLTNCTELSLADNRIRVIEPGSFNGLSNVEKLYLQHNHLTTLRAGIFQGLSSAKYLILDVNKIKFIEKNAFTGLKTLETLILLDNKLEILYPGTFCGLDTIVTLNLQKNRLTTLFAICFGQPTAMCCCPLLVEAGGTEWNHHGA